MLFFGYCDDHIKHSTVKPFYITEKNTIIPAIFWQCLEICFL